MRKALFIGLVVLAMAADCGKEAPKPRPSKPVIEAQEVALCIDSAFKTREADEKCAHAVDDCCYLRYVRNEEPWPRELPAIGEPLENGRGFIKPRPGSAPVNIPPQGAIFQR